MAIWIIFLTIYTALLLPSPIHGTGEVIDTTCAAQYIAKCAARNALCKYRKPLWSCTCKPGFTGTGRLCSDINECDFRNVNECGVGATCLNTMGSYTCKCGRGFVEDDGKKCLDINECTSTTNPHECGVGATCRNTIGSYTCECARGFETIDGITCLDINECTSRNFPAECDADATCANNIGAYECYCRQGFTGNGWTCSAAVLKEAVEPPTSPVEPPTSPAAVKVKVAAVEPPTSPVEPPTSPVEPPTSPVEPPTSPVEPPTSPVEPPTSPVESTTDHVSTVTTTPDPITYTCPGWMKLYGSMCYKLVRGTKTWDSAQNNCRRLGGKARLPLGNLATIANEETQTFLVEKVMYKRRDTWIGATDAVSDGTWLWRDSSAVGYAKWAKQQPAGGSGQNCAVIMGSGKKALGMWDDLPCTKKNWSICEFPARKN